MRIHGLHTELRPASDADADLLSRWWHDPEVSRYWDDERFSPAEVRERLRRDGVASWIVEADGAPVGYLQSWRDLKPPIAAGLDGFLIPEARGRGLMPDAARALAESLLADGWPELTVDPYAWNERALRGWANAGFVEVSRHEADEEHRHPWVLMRFERGTG